MAGNGVPNPYWAALMRFAQQVGAEDPVNQTPSHVGLLSEEDRNWLTQAMADLVKQTDPVVKMKEAMKVLMETDCQSAAESDLDRALAALETLADLVTHIDTAMNFYQIGGFRLLFPLLASSNAELRSGAANLIGELAQNNPFCQEKLREAHMIKVLEEMLATDSDNLCKTKALYALSCLVRNSPEMTEEFRRQDGVAYLLGALQSGVDKLVLKSAFLLSSILAELPHKEAAVSIGMVDQLASLLTSDIQWETREFVTAALLNLVNGCPKAQQECRRPELCLKATLEERFGAITDSEHRDERTYIRRILSVCWPTKSDAKQETVER